MADIDINDGKRVKIIKWLKKFYDEFQKINILQDYIYMDLLAVVKLI